MEQRSAPNQCTQIGSAVPDQEYPPQLRVSTSPVPHAREVGIAHKSRTPGLHETGSWWVLIAWRNASIIPLIGPQEDAMAELPLSQALSAER